MYTVALPEILAEVKNFYGNLYSQLTPSTTAYNANDPRAKLTRHYTEEIPDVDFGEIRWIDKENQSSGRCRKYCRNS